MGRVLTNNTAIAFVREESLGSSEGTKATATLTFTDQPLNTETVVIGTKTYTFQTALTEVDGNVLIGASTADSIANLGNAINLGGGAGTVYAEAMTANTDVVGVAGVTTLVITALSGGTAGNSIVKTETLTNASWDGGDGTMSGGVDPVYKNIQQNGINQWGSTISTTPRNPISKSRQRQKGSITGLESGVEFEVDVTLDSLEDFLELFCFADFTGAPVFNPSACDTDSFTVTTIGVTLAQNDLVYVQGAVNSVNNGIHLVDTGATATDIPVTTSLTAETLPAKAVLEKMGFRGASGDLSIDANGDLNSAGGINFLTGTEIQVGQSIHLGGALAANRFTAIADFGPVRVTAMTATKLTLDRANTTLVADAGVGLLIDILYGRFLRNVGVDDGDYLEQSVAFEGSFPNLDSGGATEYEYPFGNYCNQLQWNLGLDALPSMTLGFVGQDTEVPATTRRNGASAAGDPLKTGAFSTAADFMRLRIQDVDEAGLSTDFKSATITLNNNATGEVVMDNLGPKYINVGNFEVDLEAVLLFTSSDVLARVRANTTVSMDFNLRNDNGMVHVDIPSCTLGDGTREFPVNESVTLNTTIMSFEDGVLGTSVGISLFPFVPLT